MAEASSMRRIAFNGGAVKNPSTPPESPSGAGTIAMNPIAENPVAQDAAIAELSMAAFLDDRKASHWLVEMPKSNSCTAWCNHKGAEGRVPLRGEPDGDRNHRFPGWIQS